MNEVEAIRIKTMQMIHCNKSGYLVYIEEFINYCFACVYKVGSEIGIL